MPGDLGPSITSTFKDFEARLQSMETRDMTLITRGTITAYNATLHTATVTVRGASYAGIPICYSILPYVAVAAVAASATVGIIGFSSTVPANGCVVYITDSTPPPTSGGDADTVDTKHANQLQVLYATGQSTSDFSCASSGTFETDTTLTVNITPAVTSTLIVIMTAKIYSDTVRVGSWRIGLLRDAATPGGETENQATPVAASTIMGSTIAVFTAVTAAAHTIKPTIYRVNAADVISCYQRMIAVICIPE